MFPFDVLHDSTAHALLRVQMVALRMPRSSAAMSAVQQIGFVRHDAPPLCRVRFPVDDAEILEVEEAARCNVHDREAVVPVVDAGVLRRQIAETAF